MKVSELEGVYLDYWVARALGMELSDEWNQRSYVLVGLGFGDLQHFSPSTNWVQGGPIIAEKGISIVYWGESGWNGNAWGAFMYGDSHYIDENPSSDADDSPTALIAAMRCLVRKTFGEEVN